MSMNKYPKESKMKNEFKKLYDLGTAKLNNRRKKSNF